MGDPDSSGRSACGAGLLAVAAASFALSSVLIVRYPAMYWADGYGRVSARDHVLVDRWLPLLQLVVFVTSKLTPSLLALRLTLAALASGAVASAFALGARLATFRVGLVFAALAATNPLFVGLSIVPYQEVLFAGLAFAGINFCFTSRGRLGQGFAAAALNLACLTRYEGWILVGVVAAAKGMRSGPRAAVECACRCGAAAVAWLLLLALSGGVGTLMGSPSHAPEPLGPRVREYLAQCDWQIGSRWLLLFAAVGVAASIARRQDRGPHAVMLCFVGATAAFVLVAHPYSPGNLRKTFLPVVFALFYAALGLQFLVERAIRWGPFGRYRGAAPAIVVLVGAAFALASVRDAVAFVRASSAEFGGPYAVGRWFAQMPSARREHVRVGLLVPHDTDAMVIAVHSGLSESSINEVGTDVPADATHLVHIERVGEPPPGAVSALIERLGDGASGAVSTRLGSAVIWAFPTSE